MKWVASLTGEPGSIIAEGESLAEILDQLADLDLEDGTRVSVLKVSE